MNKIGPAVTIGATVVRDALRALPEATTLEDRCKAAMLAAHTDAACFLCRSEDERFKVGVGGLLLFFEGDAATTARIEREMRILSALSAAMSGVAVVFGAVFGREEEQPEPLGLLGMFREAAKRPC